VQSPSPLSTRGPRPPSPLWGLSAPLPAGVATRKATPRALRRLQIGGRGRRGAWRVGALGESAGRRGARGTRRARHSRGRPWRESQRTGSVGHSSPQCARLGQRKRARAKLLIAQARRPRIKNAHLADQERFKVAPQFEWIIFNHCSFLVLLRYDRLGRPLQTFMSAEVPRPLASMIRLDIGTSAEGQIPCWCHFSSGRDGRKPPERGLCCVQAR